MSIKARRQLTTGPGMLFVLGALFFAGCSRGTTSARGSASADMGQAQKNQPLAVKASPVKSQSIHRTIETVGSFLPIEEVNVSSEVEGRIEKTLVDVGDRVQKGQVLLTIAPEELQYELDRRASALRQVLARLGVEAGNDASRKAETEVPEVQKAGAELEQTRLNYERARELSQQALLPKQQLDDAKAKYDSARAGYEATIQQVRVTKAAVSQYQAEADLARKKLRDAQIRAPFTGWIKERLVSPGQYLRVQTPVYTIIDTSMLKFSGTVPEKMAPWVQVGASVELQVDAYPDRSFSGKITRVNPASREESRSFSVQAILENENGLLKPGIFARASIITDKEETVLTVPAAALLYGYGVYRLFVVQENRVRGMEVMIGEKIGGDYEVLQGITGNENVVITSLPKLKDGAPVKVEIESP